MKKYISLLLLLLSYVTYSQVTEEWVKRYDGPANSMDQPSSIAIDNSGNVYVTGSSILSGMFEDYCTIKYNTSGVQQWVRTYNGTGDASDLARSIALDNSGNVYVTGVSSGSGMDFDYCTIKYNSSGVQQWVRIYNGPGNYIDAASSVAVDNIGNVYVTGKSSGSGTSYDYCTIKYNSMGGQQWVQRYDGPVNGNDYAYAITVDNSGNIYVTGVSDGGTITNSDYCTVKYNSLGVQQWVRRYDGPGNNNDYANAITVDNSGNVYVTGSSDGGAGTSTDYCTIKYNSTGVQQWVKRYSGSGNSSDIAYSIAVDILGYVYVTGQSFFSGTGPDYYTIKYSSTGVQQWARRYNGTGNGIDIAYSITLDDARNAYITGVVFNGGASTDYCTIKYNPSGVQQWVQSYNSPANSNDQACGIAVDNSGNVFVTGSSYGNGTYADYCTIKYHEPIGIKQISSVIPKSFELSQNYPNPFNPITKIKFDLPPLTKGGQGGFLKLVIYDILGREVANLVNQQLKPGSYEIEWDGINYPSGVYLYKLTAGDFTNTKKMVLIK